VGSGAAAGARRRGQIIPGRKGDRSGAAMIPAVR
jgi:hypothetical protein